MGSGMSVLFRTQLVALGLSLGLPSCTTWLSPSVTDVAPVGANRMRDGYRALAVPTPENAPRGSVEVVSFGLVDLLPGQLERMPTLHVRLIVENDTDAARWSLDVRTIVLVPPQESWRRPVFVNAAAETLPIVLVSAGERSVVDAYFPVPGDGTWEDVIPFDLGWRIRTGADKVLTGRATFVPDANASPATSAAHPAVGEAKRWWADPDHPWPDHEPRPGPVVRRAPEQIRIAKPPRRHAR